VFQPTRLILCAAPVTWRLSHLRALGGTAIIQIAVSANRLSLLKKKRTKKKTEEEGEESLVCARERETNAV